MITHARAGIPWTSVLGAAVPGLLILVLAFGLGSRPWAVRLAQAGLLLLAVTASFLLDDPPAAAVEATPRSPWWGLVARLMGLAALLALVGAVAVAWDRAHPTDQAWLLALLPAIAALWAAGAAALARRWGHAAPGDFVAVASALPLLGFVLFGPRLGTLEILPAPGSAQSEELIAWGLALVASAAALAWAPSGRPSRPTTDS